MVRQEYVYQHPDSTTRAPSLHHLDVAELYTQLMEAGRAQGLQTPIHYWPEPASHMYVSAIKLRPDADVESGLSDFSLRSTAAVKPPTAASTGRSQLSRCAPT